MGSGFSNPIESKLMNDYSRCFLSPQIPCLIAVLDVASVEKEDASLIVIDLSVLVASEVVISASRMPSTAVEVYVMVPEVVVTNFM